MTFRRLYLAAASLAAFAVPLQAQQQRALDHADYALWKRIQNDVVSRDGHWLAYRLTPGDGDAALLVRELSGQRSATIDRGGPPTLTADGRWLVARIAPMDAAVKQAKKEKKKPADQPKDSLIVLDLSSLDPGSAFRAERVKSFKVPEDGSTWIAYLLEKAPDAKKPADAKPDEAAAEKPAGEKPDSAKAEKKKPRTPDGATLVVRDLASGNERRFEHVVDYAFDKAGTVLYYTASGEDGAADGVFRVGPSGAASSVATGEGRYLQMAVSDGGRVAFVTDRDDRASEAPAFALYVAPHSGEAASMVAVGTAGLQDGWAPSQNGSVHFSKSGERVFFGANVRPQPEPEDTTPEDERVKVDIWNWKDPYLQPMQLLQANQEMKRTYEAWVDVDGKRVVQLETPDLPSVTVGADGDGTYALGYSELPYRQEISWDGRYVDIYAVSVADGGRERVAEHVKSFPRMSPAGKYAYWFDGVSRSWKTLDLRTRQIADVTSSIEEPFYDVLDDHPDLPPSYGSAGWTEGDGAFLVNDEFDVWAVDPTGRKAPRNVTDGMGRKQGLRFRYADAAGTANRDGIPADEDELFLAFDEATKASGFYRDRVDGSREPQRVIMGDYAYGSLRKAEDANVFTFERQSFEEYPDIWVTDAAFSSPRKVTDANPQQSDYLWGKAELVHWTSTDGTPLSGILIRPGGFEAGKKYPMMVYFYERMSDGLHRYVVPAPGSSSINWSFYASRGYVVFIPDIPYEVGHPGESSLDAVVPGVLEVADMGFVDRAHIGVQGHSWGGYQIAWMITHTNIFAAAEAGAPVANMTSAYGGIRWGTGMSRAFQYERTQSRIGGSLWEKPLLYIENSPIFTADKIQTPLLMMHNDADTAVPWYQGIEMFSALRRLHKPVWLVVYNGEFHGLSKEQNRKDWTIRLQQFFDHYLMGAPAPVWMEEGVPAVLKGKTLGLELESGSGMSHDTAGTGR